MAKFKYAKDEKFVTCKKCKNKALIVHHTVKDEIYLGCKKCKNIQLHLRGTIRSA